MARSSYSSIPGSGELRTHAIGADPEVEALESADRAATVGAEVEGEWLARTLVREDYVPVLLDVFDRLALGLSALEQVTYLHLYRLALGDERNFCRVSRGELRQRCQLSDRRLGKALAGLVEKGHVRLVQRDRAGTLYRVLMPHEVLGEPDRGRVFIARTPNSVSKQQPVERVVHRPSAADKALSVGRVVADFIDEFGDLPGRSRAELVEIVLDRMEEGAGLAQIAAELTRFGKKAPKRTPVAELRRFLG